MSDTRYALAWLTAPSVHPTQSGLEFFDTRLELDTFRGELEKMFGAEVECLPFAVSPIGAADAHEVPS